MRFTLVSMILLAGLLSMYSSTVMATNCNLITTQADFEARIEGRSIFTMTKKLDKLNDIFTGTLSTNHAPYYFTAHHQDHEGTFQVSVGLVPGIWTDHPKVTLVRATFENGKTLTAVVPPRVNGQSYNCDIKDSTLGGHKVTKVQVYNAKW